MDEFNGRFNSFCEERKINIEQRKKKIDIENFRIPAIEDEVD
jgi:hypothetical protein